VKGLLATILSAATAVGVGDAVAHSFRVGFIAPTTGAEMRSGQEALDGFMLATRERDSHPDETSDGHLGGLDVHVTVIDSSRGQEETLHQVERLVVAGGTEFLTGLVSPRLREEVTRIGGGKTRLIDPRKTWLPPSDDSASGELLTMNKIPFAVAFTSEYGYPPTRSAARGYTAARLIDHLVRAVGGDLSNSDVIDFLLWEAGPR